MCISLDNNKKDPDHRRMVTRKGRVTLPSIHSYQQICNKIEGILCKRKQWNKVVEDNKKFMGTYPFHLKNTLLNMHYH